MVCARVEQQAQIAAQQRRHAFAQERHDTVRVRVEQRVDGDNRGGDKQHMPEQVDASRQSVAVQGNQHH